MITALTLASNLSLQEEQQQREHRDRRDAKSTQQSYQDIHHTFSFQWGQPTAHHVLLKSHAMNSVVTQWFVSVPPVPQTSFHFPESNANKELIHPTPWISTLLQRPSADPCAGWTQSYSQVSLPPLRSTLPAQPSAFPLYKLRWEGLSLLSSKIAKCFLLDQRRSKLVNHTANAAVARQLPSTAVCTLPANRRCNLLLQAELSIIPDINHWAWTKRPLYLARSFYSSLLW